jgi:methyltransferase family protein
MSRTNSLLLRQQSHAAQISKHITWRYLNAKWRQRDYVVSHLKRITPEFYECYKNVREIEHQAGRYLHMLAIAKELPPGDIVEFGTYQGLGLAMMSQAFGSRLYIGIDFFEGLPESSTIWDKGLFNDTSKEFTARWLHDLGVYYHLIKGRFSDPIVKRDLATIAKDVALVHFDADLGSSTVQALKLIEPYVVKGRPIYFLFDDWGVHPDEVPEAFYAWLAQHPTFDAEKLSSTRYTRYYRLTES